MMSPSEPARTTTAHDIFQSALQCHATGDAEGAEALCKKILTNEPAHADALSLSGVLMLERGRNEDALLLLNRALAVNPNQATALSNRGLVLQRLGRPEEALASCDAALAIDLAQAEAHNNRGIALRDLRRFSEALLSFEHALALNPMSAEAFNNRGATLLWLNRFEDALADYDHALALKPALASSHFNRGKVLVELARHDEALASYNQAIALNPQSADAHWAKGMLCLLRGEYLEGWALMEWRWRSESHHEKAHAFAQPLWLGQTSLSGKTILIHAEQGFGDTLQFARYLPLVQKQALRVLVLVQPQLKIILKSLGIGCELFGPGEALPPFDVHCPLMSLPLAFKTTVETIPASTHYLAAPSDKVAHWRTALDKPNMLRVGLAWSGRSTHKNDGKRSIPLGFLVPLLDVACEFHAVQTDFKTIDEHILAVEPRIKTHRDALRDFSDTAALIANLDVVISVDTSVAHLAGALGKPVWILLPFASDYRWLLDREDSPWYPSARLFRQRSRGDWPEVLARVATALKEFQQAR